MDAINGVVAPLIHESYVGIAPNLRIAGHRLRRGERVVFNVPVAGTYALYSENGAPLGEQVEINGRSVAVPVQLGRGRKMVVLRAGPDTALLLPHGSYAGRIVAGRDNDELFARVYD